MKKMENIAIVGAGALGILYGDMLMQTYGKEHVYFAADEKRVETYRQHGFSCNGNVCDFRYESFGHAGTADLVLFAVKYTGLKDAVEASRPLIGPDTLVISVLNGIASEVVIGDAYGDSHVIHCVAQGMDAVKDGNALTYKNKGILVIGRKENDLPGAVAEVGHVLEEAGISCLSVDNIMYRIWSKLMMNTGLNQVCAVYGISYGGVQTEGEARQTMLAAMREVMEVASYEEITLTEEDIHNWMKLIDSLNPAGLPSMRQDTKAGRKTEVELFSGTICSLGKKYGVPTPVNDDLYEKIRNIEREFDSFYAEPLPDEVFAKMNGCSFKEGGVSTREELCFLHVLHYDFQGQVCDGELVSNAAIAEDLLNVMKELYDAGYPIEHMILVDNYDGDDIRSMEDNNSSCFNDRLISGTNRPSKHAYGMAVDINPLYNPYVKTKDGELICEPPSAISYIDRNLDFPHKIEREDICCSTFLKYGFSWGGDWETAKDYQHFEKKK